jgi:hypothetical protein
MNSVYIHIDETLDSGDLQRIGSELKRIPQVTDVEFNDRQPHDVLVEYTPHPSMPMGILQRLTELGVHSDVTSC